MAGGEHRVVDELLCARRAVETQRGADEGAHVVREVPAREAPLEVHVVIDGARLRVEELLAAPVVERARGVEICALVREDVEVACRYHGREVCACVLALVLAALPPDAAAKRGVYLARGEMVE